MESVEGSSMEREAVAAVASGVVGSGGWLMRGGASTLHIPAAWTFGSPQQRHTSTFLSSHAYAH